MKSDEEILAEEILKYRVKNNLTQNEFAAKCGIGRCSLIAAEKGSPSISKKMRTRIMLFIENN